MQITIPQIDLYSVSPEIVLTLFGIIVLLTGVFSVRSGKDNLGYMTFAGVLGAAYFVTCGWGSTVTSFSGMWVVDDFSRFFKLIILLGTGLTALISVNYLEDENISPGEYYAILLFASVGMMVLSSAADLVTVFLGIELMSICLYILAGITRVRSVSTESSLKYFILGSFASGFLLYGMALLYGATGTTNLTAIGEYILSAQMTSKLLLMAMLLLTVGFGFKVALVPFHMWSPDVYEGAPAPISGFMSAGPKAAAFAAFIRVFSESLPYLKHYWTDLFWVIAVITMTVANITALRQNNIKRMLAYSSVSHAGFVLMGLVAGTADGISSMLYYLLVYTFMNVGAFAVITVVAGQGEKRVAVSDFAGLWKTNPLLTLTMTVFLFSLAGIPPMGGFVAKFYVFAAAMKSGYVWLSIIAILNSVVAVYYYLRVSVMMYMKEPEEGLASLKISPAIALALIISIYGVLKTGIIPSDYITYAYASVIQF